MKSEVAANSIKAALTVFFASFVAYFANVAAPLIVLFIVVVTDYVTGLIKAYSSRTLSSRIGFTGILKKLSYFVVVGVGMIVDYLISSGIKQINAEFTSDLSIVSIIVIIWLIINELLSILENLSAIGVPLPSFLKKLIERLLVTVEKKADEAVGSKDEDKEEETEEQSEEENLNDFIFSSEAKRNEEEDKAKAEDVFAKDDENEHSVELPVGEYADDTDADNAPKGEM